MDHVKNMLDPADARTIEARFHDFTMPESCARFVTGQDVGKLLSTFQKLGADTGERELRALAGHDEDAKAILRRCVFVEAREHVRKPEMRKTHWETRCSKGQQMREAANLLRSEGEENLGAQLGVWR